MDSGDGHAIHFFVRAGLRALGEIVFWVGAKGRHKACPYRRVWGLGGLRAGTGPEPAVVAAGGFAARQG